VFFPSQPVVIFVHIAMKNKVNDEKPSTIVHDSRIEPFLIAPGTISSSKRHHKVHHIKDIHHHEIKIGFAS